MIRILLLGLAVTALGKSCPAQTLKDAELRIWSDVRGNEITARLSRYKEGIVYLRTNLRQNIQIPPNQLSKKDQDYVVEILKKTSRTKEAKEFLRLTETSSRKSGQTNPGRFGSGSAATPSSSSGQPPASGASANPRGSPGSARGGNLPSSGNEYNGVGNQTGGRRPGFAGGGPGVSPAGDGPVTSGRSNGRAPSPYTRSPDDEQAAMGANPNRPLKQFDPFSDSAKSPSPSPRKSSGSAVSSNFGSERSSKPANPNVDPFADLGSSVRNSNDATESSGKSMEAEPTKNYQPPVLSNGVTNAVPSENRPAAAATVSSGWSGTTMILVAIGIVGLLFLVMIALLIMVLAKSNQVPQRRTHY